MAGICFSAILLVIAAFAVDLGVQRVLRRDLQAMVDVIALDMARDLDGRTQAVIKASSAWRNQLGDSTSRNLNMSPAPAVSVQQLQADAIATVSGSDMVVTATMGLVDPITGQFSTMPYPEVATAVMVVAQSTVDFAFVPGSGGATRSAVAVAEGSACFKVGSYAAAIKSGDSTLLAPLNSFLGLNLSLLSYQGLAGGSVSLAELVATGQLGTTDQLLTGSTTLGRFQAATLSALNSQSPRNTAAVTALQSLISASVNQTKPVKIGDVINIDPADTAALTAKLNVLDVLTGAAMVANGDNAVAISGLSAGTATVGGVTVNTLKVTERPSLACGTVANAPSPMACAAATKPLPRGCAQNSQLRGDATIPLTLRNATVGSSFFKVSTPGSNLSLSLGNASGTLMAPEPTCGLGTSASPDTLNVALSTSAATATLTTGLHFETNALPLLLLPTVIVKVDYTSVSSIPPPPATGSAALTIPPNDVTPVSGGSDVRLSSLSTAAPVVTLTVTTVDGLPIIGALLGTVTTALNTTYGITAATAGGAVQSVTTGVLNPLIASLNTLLLGPLASLVGLDLAGADVFAVGRPECQSPNLVG
ncbi:MAG: hypothetical protein WKF79_12675 [Nocardioides sp.]